MGCRIIKRKSNKNGIAKRLRQKMLNSGGREIQRPKTPEVLINSIAKFRKVLKRIGAVQEFYLKESGVGCFWILPVS